MMNGAVLLLSESGGCKEQEHGQQFQAPGQHIKNQNHLGKAGKNRIIRCWSHHINSRPDIVEAGDGGGKVGFKPEGFEADKQKRRHYHEHICAEVGRHAGRRAVVNLLALEVHGGDGARVKQLFYLPHYIYT